MLMCVHKHPAGHVTATQPSHALQEIHGKMQVSGYLGSLPVGSNTTTGELSAIQREGIINGLLFPLNNMTDCAYNASCFDAGHKGPVLRAPTSYRLITLNKVTENRYIHTCEQTRAHAYHRYTGTHTHTYLHTELFVCVCVHAFTHTCMNAQIHAFILR
jgi:hypothetical protein